MVSLGIYWNILDGSLTTEKHKINSKNLAIFVVRLFPVGLSYHKVKSKVWKLSLLNSSSFFFSFHDDMDFVHEYTSRKVKMVDIKKVTNNAPRSKVTANKHSPTLKKHRDQSYDCDVGLTIFPLSLGRSFLIMVLVYMASKQM